jgi:hypothetical protein|tara:strand:+ start:1276 stop:1389 length:114 start_codon:yes stop_codon:yes gene_type:complete
MDENVKKELQKRRPLNLLAIVLALLFVVFGFLLFFKS